MKIYVVGSSKNNFLPLDNIREKFLVDEKHEGDNIDFLNPWYCELTGLYYLWKHVDDEIVGLEHYRRSFVNKNNDLLSENEINLMLMNKDIICSKKVNRIKLHHNNVKTVEEELSLIVKDPLFLKTIKYYTEISNKGAFWNKVPEKHSFIMFICKRNILDEWCSFFFDFMKKYLELRPVEKISKRAIGYIAEYLFSEFIDTKNNISNTVLYIDKQNKRELI